MAGETPQNDPTPVGSGQSRPQARMHFDMQTTDGASLSATATQDGFNISCKNGQDAGFCEAVVKGFQQGANGQSKHIARKPNGQHM